jgi:TetR/AcrR family transcriptional repressor of nem operon
MTTAGTTARIEDSILNAALHVIPAKGYSATLIKDICEAPGLTEGRFLHYFDSKIALAPRRGWSESILKMTANFAEDHTVGRE